MTIRTDIYGDPFLHMIVEVAHNDRTKVIAVHGGANSIFAAKAAFEAIQREHGSLTMLMLREKSRVLRLEPGTRGE